MTEEEKKEQDIINDFNKIRALSKLNHPFLSEHSVTILQDFQDCKKWIMEQNELHPRFKPIQIGEGINELPLHIHLACFIDLLIQLEKDYLELHERHHELQMKYAKQMKKEKQ